MAGAWQLGRVVWGHGHEGSQGRERVCVAIPAKPDEQGYCMDFFQTIMFPFNWFVSVIMVGFHDGLSTIGLPAANGWTWTLSIIGLVLVIRAALIPVFVKQIKAQRGMQLLQPDMKKLQDKYKGKTDQLSRQAMAQEQMALYKKHGTNPFSACLPLLIQMPFFLALFTVLSGISTARVQGKGIGAMSHEQVVQFDDSSIFGAPLSASLLHGPEATCSGHGPDHRDDPGHDGLAVHHAEADHGQEHVRRGHGQPVHEAAEDDALHPAGRLRRRRHQLPHRCPDLLDHHQPLDHGAAVLRDPPHADARLPRGQGPRRAPRRQGSAGRPHSGGKKADGRRGQPPLRPRTPITSASSRIVGTKRRSNG